MWNLPGPGIKPMSPALAGRFLSTIPPGKSGTTCFKYQFTDALFIILQSFIPHLGLGLQVHSSFLQGLIILQFYPVYFSSQMFISRCLTRTFFFLNISFVSSYHVHTFLYLLTKPGWLCTIRIQTFFSITWGNSFQTCSLRIIASTPCVSSKGWCQFQHAFICMIQ